MQKSFCVLFFGICNFHFGICNFCFGPLLHEGRLLLGPLLCQSDILFSQVNIIFGPLLCQSDILFGQVNLVAQIFVIPNHIRSSYRNSGRETNQCTDHLRTIFKLFHKGWTIPSRNGGILLATYGVEVNSVCVCKSHRLKLKQCSTSRATIGSGEKGRPGRHALLLLA